MTEQDVENLTEEIFYEVLFWLRNTFDIKPQRASDKYRGFATNVKLGIEDLITTALQEEGKP